MSLLLFPMGLSYKYVEDKFINKPSRYIIITLCLLFAAILTLSFLHILHIKFTYIGIVNLAPYIFILPLTVIKISSKFLKFLGSISYEIYLIQGVVFGILKEVLKNYSVLNSDYIYIVGSLFFIIISAKGIKYILNKTSFILDKIKK